MANLDDVKSRDWRDIYKQNDFTTGSDLWECLLWNNSEETKYEELKDLLEQWNYDKIKEHIHKNEELRTSMHEAAHVIVGKSFWLKIGSVTIWEQDNEQDFSIQKKIGWKSSWQTRWNFLQFTDKSFIQTSLAWYVAECALGINYKDANKHAQQDINDILNRIEFDVFYEKWRKPKGFNDRWDLIGEKIKPKLTREQVREELLKLASKEMKPVASIIWANRYNLYKLWIEIYWKKELTDIQVNSILEPEKPVEKI